MKFNLLILLFFLSLVILTAFQNCSSEIGSFTTLESNLKLDSANSNLTSLKVKTANSSNVLMYNNLRYSGTGKENPFFNAQIKNILVFQVGGWSGLPTEKGTDPEWPLDGGRAGYLSRNPIKLQSQLDLIKNLGKSVAISVLLMTDNDSKASGYGTCWKGTWIKNQTCQGGKWQHPLSLYSEVKNAAWIKGLQVAPYISLMNYEFPAGTAGDRILPKLKETLKTLRQTFDATSLRTSDGKWVVMVDSLPEWAGLSEKNKVEIYSYMKAQTDIFWIDNLVGSYVSDRNIYRSAATFDRSGSIQDNLASIWGDKYLWWFTTGFAKTWSERNNPDNNIPHVVREKWMNILPHDPNRYPVIISQWNEYAEYLIFEPSTKSNRSNYDYLKWMISRQP